MERMEEKMKGTEFEKALPQMFSGKIKTYISCINVPYESSRIEDFWDVQLNVSGNENLLDSFQDYIQVEKLDGENQYFAGDQYKLQDANKGVIFQAFPDVLHLQLKRFEYDIQRDAMMKINDRYEFPEDFDASLYLDKDADRSESWEYQLHGVLVHSGDLNAGHYYAFLKPNKEGWWYKYDDDKVTKATKREVLEENFGGPFKLPNGQTRPLGNKKGPLMRPNSAYMLVYIRKSRLDKVLCPVTAEDTPEHLRKLHSLKTLYREGTDPVHRQEIRGGIHRSGGAAQGEGRAASLHRRKGHHRSDIPATWQYRPDRLRRDPGRRPGSAQVLPPPPHGDDARTGRRDCGRHPAGSETRQALDHG
jgi:ubiquitin carboxyl-terminal hydrolase 7